MRFTTPDGFIVLVGKNSLQNERLLKAAQGNDLWLHAKDMPGSHVIVRAEGKEVSGGDASFRRQAGRLLLQGQGQAGARQLHLAQVC